MFRRTAPPADRALRRAPAAVLFDRDGTLIEDVPYNGDPDRVRPIAGARGALDRLRARGVRIGVVTAQSGIARGILTHSAVDAVHRRVEELLGPIDVWQVCVHSPADRCHCRVPAPGLVLAAARRLGAPPSRCVMIGDSVADTQAARSAGAVGVLVPRATTRPADLAAARTVASDICAAVDWALGGSVVPAAHAWSRQDAAAASQ